MKKEQTNEFKEIGLAIFAGVIVGGIIGAILVGSEGDTHCDSGARHRFKNWTDVSSSKWNGFEVYQQRNCELCNKAQVRAADSNTRH